jgi:hypothetical protein
MNLQLPESYLIRVWTEPTGDPSAEAPDAPILRGSIQHVASGHRTYFSSLELPVALLKASVDRLSGREQPLD